MKLNLELQKYKLIIFDWDGTLVDSLGSYKEWDRLYLKKFYDVDVPVKYIEDLAKEMKTVSPGSSENKYFRYLDTKYGNGKTPMNLIWENIYSLASEIQGGITYRKHAPEALRLLRSRTGAYLALATNAERRDIEYFSSRASRTAPLLSPMDFFDTVVTSDHVEHPKPHPETFQKVIEQYAVAPDEVLIFEDSLSGIVAARACGADVVAILADETASEYAHIVMSSWSDLLVMLGEDMS